MISIVRVAAFLLLGTLCTASAESQPVLQDELLAKAYRDGPGHEAVQDPFHVLRDKPELKAELSTAITRLEQRHGFRIRLLIRPVWMGGTVQELATALQSVWFPQGDGLVMIVETDNRSLGLGVSMHGSPKDGSWLMPTHSSAAILKRVADRADRDLPLDDYLKNIVLDMTAEHEAYLAKRLEQPTLGQILQENLFLMGALCITALGAIAVAAWARASRIRNLSRVRRFPIVDIPERLGAPYGGGSIATLNFNKRQP